MSNSFYIQLYMTVTILFILGGLGLFVLNRAKPVELKIKFWVYMGLVFGHLILLQFYIPGFRALSFFFLAIGLYEIIKQLPSLMKDGRILVFITALLTYVAICWLYIHFLYLQQGIILFVFFLVVVFDGFGQLFGVILGKTKLMKYISPGKTWEGLIGGISGSVLIMILFKNDFSTVAYKMFLQGFVVVLFAFCGDLLASVLKRKIGIKDFSRAIPGHGGVLDRFDSLFVAGSAIYILSVLL